MVPVSYTHHGPSPPPLSLLSHCWDRKRGASRGKAGLSTWEVWGGEGYHGLAYEAGQPQEGQLAAGNTPHTAPG